MSLPPDAVGGGGAGMSNAKLAIVCMHLARLPDLPCRRLVMQPQVPEHSGYLYHCEPCVERICQFRLETGDFAGWEKIIDHEVVPQSMCDAMNVVKARRSRHE